jgi:cardiolipin synthase
MFWLAIVGAGVLAWTLLVILFAPSLKYHLRERVPISSDRFLHTLQAICQSTIHRGNRMQVLTNGPTFYPAMIAAIRAAEHSVNLECYMFRPGRVADEFVDALSDRARHGVVVSLVADAIGSLRLFGKPVRTLREAGARVNTYQALRWYSIARINNRTHRELLIIDGKVAFVGGAGVADAWQYPEGKKRHWRDTMVRVEGPAVASIQGVFVENWLECCGEVLTGDAFFPRLDPGPIDASTAGPSEAPCADEGDESSGTTAFLVKSSPSDRATVSRIVFQSLIEGADERLSISTPYFLPDRALRRTLIRTARRGVDMRIIVPGSATDQRWVRLASRRVYGSLLRAGIRIFEYRPAMMHAKILLADHCWSVIGTTNMDNRSFEHNDEVNMIMLDDRMTRRLREDFERDLTVCQEITLAAWNTRPLWEKALNPIVWILERQQ